MSLHDDLVGTVLAETYRITRLLGQGGMGTVWEADHVRLPGKRVAIKMLHGAGLYDPDSIARFRREATILSRIGHASIVDVIDVNVSEDDRPFQVLELLEGETLHARLARGPMPLAEAMALIEQIGSALQAAHIAGIVHRDLKPANVFCVRDDRGQTRAKVLDFGIAKVFGGQSLQTRAGTVLGTPQYMAPEQAEGSPECVDARADVFALGAMSYEMLGGRPAFDGDTPLAVTYKVVHAEPRPLRELAPHVPASTIAAIERALAKDRAARFQDVPSFLAALSASNATGPADTLGIPEPAVTQMPAAASAPPSPTTMASRRNRALRWVALGLAVLAGALVAVVLATAAPAPTTTVAGAPVSTKPAPPQVKRGEAASLAPEAPPIEEAEPLFEVSATPDVDGDDDAGPTRPTSRNPRTKRTPQPRSPVSDQARQLLVQAANALDKGRSGEALRLARRSLQLGKTAVAYAIMTRAYCKQKDQGNAVGAFRRIPRGRRKALVRRWCAKYEINL